MRVLLFLAILAITVYLVCSTSINPERRLINRPSHSTFFRNIRAAQQVKGFKQYHAKGDRPPPLRKGEYKCGNKICKLKPGEEPENCNGMCQYPITY